MKVVRVRDAERQRERRGAGGVREIQARANGALRVIVKDLGLQNQ